MKTYNYFENVKNDVLAVIAEREIIVTSENKEEIYEELYDNLWINDSVTGNASGSYTFNAWEAEENICHNMDLLREACEEFGCDMGELVEKGAESCDVTIRCYLLGQCLLSALDDVQVEEEETEEA